MILENKKVFALHESQDGHFSHATEKIIIDCENIEDAKKLADEYTENNFSKYSGFYSLVPKTIKFLKNEI